MVKLFQAGEIIAGDGYEIQEHTQACSEISYIVSGECDIYTDQRIFHAKEGDIHVICPGKHHKILAGSSNFRMAYIGFYFHEKENAAPTTALETFFTTAPTELKNDRVQLKAAFEHLLTEIYISRDYHKEVVDACITQILVYVFRIFRYGENQSCQRLSDEVRQERIVGHTVFKALRYIDADPLAIQSVSQVAKELKYNAAYLSKIFHEKMGMTISDYITGKKIDTAAQLLAEGVSISETAQRLGYATSQSFCKMLRKHTGKTPSEFRAAKE